jgi:putative tryptophan/tyrosine transport system substrate-binding protein
VLAVGAQQARKVYRVGVLREGADLRTQAFADAMREFGWIEAQNLKIERRHADTVDKLPTLASELVGLKVDVILTTGTPATRTAKEATKTIPIVFIVVVDPVETGLVASFARPGGNITGFALVTYGGKLLEVLKEAVPEPEPLELPIDLRVRYHQNTLPEAPYF